jgi:hypothetical protein
MLNNGTPSDSAPRLVQLSGAGSNKAVSALSFDETQTLGCRIKDWQPTGGFTLALVMRLRGKPVENAQRRVLTLVPEGAEAENVNFGIITTFTKEGRPILGAFGSNGVGDSGFFAVRLDRPTDEKLQILVVTLDPGSKQIRGSLLAAGGKLGEDAAVLRSSLSHPYQTPYA